LDEIDDVPGRRELRSLQHDDAQLLPAREVGGEVRGEPLEWGPDALVRVGEVEDDLLDVAVDKDPVRRRQRPVEDRPERVAVDHPLHHRCQQRLGELEVLTGGRRQLPHQHLGDRVLRGLLVEDVVGGAGEPVRVEDIALEPPARARHGEPEAPQDEQDDREDPADALRWVHGCPSLPRLGLPMAEVAGIEPTGRGSPVPLVLKTRGATRPRSPPAPV
jgi:hypothetical protein